MKYLRTRLVISWLLFAGFLFAFWLAFYTFAIFVVFPAIVLVRHDIRTRQLSTVERRASAVAAVIICTFLFLALFWEAFPPFLVIVAQVVGVLSVLACGIFTDYSKFKQVEVGEIITPKVKP